MKVSIVTGAFGYIGSILSKVLKGNNEYVVGIDNDTRCLKPEFRNRTHICDLFLWDDFDSQTMYELLKKYPNATIYHLAANSLLGPSAYDPLSYFENNTFKTMNLIKNLKETHKLIFASTAAVYAITNKIVKEKDRLNPPNNYGKSKLWCEELIDALVPISKFKALSFRFFNVIGAYENLGQLPNTPHIINQLCESAKNNKSFIIYGNDYPTIDGTCVRDYVHVTDIARALIHGADYLSTIDNGQHFKYNLGTNKGTTVKQIVDTFNHVAKKVEVEIGEERIGDPPWLVANPNQFMLDTKFQYIYKSEDLPVMIDSAWRYANSL